MCSHPAWRSRTIAQLRCCIYLRPVPGTPKFEMQYCCPGLVHDREALLPESDAVIRLLVVRRAITWIKPTEALPDGARRRKKGAGAIVHVAPEHEVWVLGIAAAAIS